MPSRPVRPSGRQSPQAQREPSYQIGIPIDGADPSALQPGGDRFDQDETAQDHPAPPPEQRTSTEVSLPEDLPSEEQAGEAPPAPAPASPPARSAPAPARPRSGAMARPGASGRGAAARSARSPRVQRGSATSVAAPVVSSRRKVTATDRSGLQRTLLRVGVGVLITIVVVVGVILWMTHGSEDRRAGGEALAEAGRQHELIKTALSNRRGAEARKAYDAALQALTKTPQLGGAVAMPSEERPVVRELAVQAFQLRGEVEALNDRVTDVQNENAAEANLAALKTRFGGLQATDLEALERDVLAYIDNPVDPKAGASAVKAQAFSRLVGEAKLRLASIATERERRKSESTVVPLRQAAVETDGLCQQERFGDALAKIESMGKAHPEADFTALRAQVEAAAEKSWASAKAQVENKLADWRAPGSTAGQRKAALTAAKDRLGQVVERFGIASYVEQARTMLAPLP